MRPLCFTEGIRGFVFVAGTRAARHILLRATNKVAGDCPDFVRYSEQNGTVPLSAAALLVAVKGHAMLRSLRNRFAIVGAIAIVSFALAAPCRAWQSPWSAAPAAAPVYQAQYYGGTYAPPPAPAAVRASNYNPVGFGFGGYSYGSYPAYGFNGYLPAAYAGFNTTSSPVGGYSVYRASDIYGAACGPNGCRMNYQGW